MYRVRKTSVYRVRVFVPPLPGRSRRAGSASLVAGAVGGVSVNPGSGSGAVRAGSGVVVVRRAGYFTAPAVEQATNLAQTPAEAKAAVRQLTLGA